MKKTCDFTGWATRTNIKCSDGRTIMDNAFKDQNGCRVPLVWNHNHDNPDYVLGHADLENRKGGVYAYCTFNKNPKGQQALEQVRNGDITSLSIFANKLSQNSKGEVYHGMIREVSLVLAGANPGAYIEDVMLHTDDDSVSALIFNDSETLEMMSHDVIEHKEQSTDKEDEIVQNNEQKNSEQLDEKSIKDVFESLTEEQKQVVYYLVGAAAEQAKSNGDKQEGTEVKHNAFENENVENENVISHADIMDAIADAKKGYSLKDTFLAHGINNLEYLFPDAQAIENKPSFINTNPQGWIDEVMNGVHHTPFARVKMLFADITAEEARANGYIKGDKKLDEVFTLLRRTIEPQTVYKHQSLDRDDIVDITDLDTIAWIKTEMRMKLNEELARAYLFGDGRATSNRQKIKETNIMPVLKDTEENLYAMVKEVSATDYDKVIDGVVESLDDYEGSGNTTAFIKQAAVTKMLLLRDENNRRIYKTQEELATALNVNKIVKVPNRIVPEGYLGVILDLSDYNVGADKGGAVSMFEDFDIDYNKQKYLIETRCSGGLTKPHSAIVLKQLSE